MIEMWAGIGGRGLVLGRGVPAVAGRVKAKKRGRGIGWSGEIGRGPLGEKELFS
jgi:hypothetical protein